MDEPTPGELARVLDHRLGRSHVVADDPLQPSRQLAVQLADIADAVHVP
jgi:hypothetical protein